MRASVASQHRKKVEVLIAFRHFEANSQRAIVFAHENAVPQHAMHEIRRNTIEHDDVCGSGQRALQLGRDPGSGAA